MLSMQYEEAIVMFCFIFKTWILNALLNISPPVPDQLLVTLKSSSLVRLWWKMPLKIFVRWSPSKSWWKVGVTLENTEDVFWDNPSVGKHTYGTPAKNIFSAVLSKDPKICAQKDVPRLVCMFVMCKPGQSSLVTSGDPRRRLSRRPLGGASWEILGGFNCSFSRQSCSSIVVEELPSTDCLLFYCQFLIRPVWRQYSTR